MKKAQKPNLQKKNRPAGRSKLSKSPSKELIKKLGKKYKDAVEPPSRKVLKRRLGEAYKDAIFPDRKALKKKLGKAYKEAVEPRRHKTLKYVLAGLVAVIAGALMAVVNASLPQGATGQQTESIFGQQLYRATHVLFGKDDEDEVGKTATSDADKADDQSEDKAAAVTSGQTGSTAPVTPPAAPVRLPVFVTPVSIPDSKPVTPPPVNLETTFDLTGAAAITIHRNDPQSRSISTTDGSSVHWQFVEGNFMWINGVSSGEDDAKVLMFLNFPPYTYDGAVLNYTIFTSPEAVLGDYVNTVQVTDTTRGISQNFPVKITVVE